MDVVKKCHMIMSGNDCWNSVCFSCCRKADNEYTNCNRLFTVKLNVALLVSQHKYYSDTNID